MAGTEYRANKVPSATAFPPSHQAVDVRERAFLLLLGSAILLYFAIIFSASKWEMETLRFGYDPVVYEQPIWNTLHGHIMEQSTYSYTHLAFGWDLLLFNFVLLPFYALHPATVTLLFLQTFVTALGAVAVYVIARDRLPQQRFVALLVAVLYLSYLPLQGVNLYEVSPRLFATTFFLFAFWCMTRGYAVAFWVLIILAIINRSDAALVVAMLGVYGVTTRQRFALSWLPLAIGATYWVLAVFVIVPAFAHGAQFSYLQNYAWLGPDAGTIAKTLVTHPVFVLRQVLAPDRWQYVLSLLFALAFLPLLQPRQLLPALPSFLVNVFAGPEFRYQRDIYHQYNAFIIPWLFIAAIFAIAALADGTHPLLRFVLRLRKAAHTSPHRRIATGFVLLMLLLSAIQQAYTQPNRTQLFLLQREDKGRIAALNRLMPFIPPDAPLAVTNVAATRVPMRRYLYYFPGDRYYDPRNIDLAIYLLGDRSRDSGQEGQELDALEANGQWELLRRSGDFELLHRVAPAPAREGR